MSSGYRSKSMCIVLNTLPLCINVLGSPIVLLVPKAGNGVTLEMCSTWRNVQ